MRGPTPLAGSGGHAQQALQRCQGIEGVGAVAWHAASSTSRTEGIGLAPAPPALSPASDGESLIKSAP